jgi:hypothetical protein
MNRDGITERYLTEITRCGVNAGEALGKIPESPLLNSLYKGRYMSRPVFADRAQLDQLNVDLETLRDALFSLTDKCFGGDIGAFARSVGMPELQVDAVVRSRGRLASRQARADLYLDDSGFKVLEFNMGSGCAGMDNADFCTGLLEHPILADLAATHRLGFVDSMREQVNDVFVETGLAPDSFPVVALTHWPHRMPDFEPYMHELVARWRELGFDAMVCHAGQLEFRDGRVWLHDRAVDVIYRMFILDDLLGRPESPALLAPILDAVQRGEVHMFTPCDSELYGCKAALAMVSDERNRHLFSEAELACFDRVVPWTRHVRPGPVLLPDGDEGDLFAYALAHKDELVLKPTLLYGGHGIVAGWHPDTTEDEWRQQLEAAFEQPYVIQRRVRPVPELFVDDGGQLAPHIVVWGVFTTNNGHGGVMARSIPVASNVDVINLDRGALFGGCLTIG